MSRIRLPAMIRSASASAACAIAARFSGPNTPRRSSSALLFWSRSLCFRRSRSSLRASSPIFFPSLCAASSSISVSSASHSRRSRPCMMRSASARRASGSWIRLSSCAVAALTRSATAFCGGRLFARFRSSNSASGVPYPSNSTASARGSPSLASTPTGSSRARASAPASPYSAMSSGMDSLSPPLSRGVRRAFRARYSGRSHTSAPACLCAALRASFSSACFSALSSAVSFLYSLALAASAPAATASR